MFSFLLLFAWPPCWSEKYGMVTGFGQDQPAPFTFVIIKESLEDKALISKCFRQPLLCSNKCCIAQAAQAKCFRLEPESNCLVRYESGFFYFLNKTVVKQNSQKIGDNLTLKILMITKNLKYVQKYK